MSREAALRVVVAERVDHLGVSLSTAGCRSGCNERKRGQACQFPYVSNYWAWVGLGSWRRRLCPYGAVELELSVVACERGVLRAGDAFLESAVSKLSGRPKEQRST